MKRTKFLTVLSVLGLVTVVGFGVNANGADRAKESADNSRFSDRAHKSAWEKGKEELARALKVGEDRDFYRKELEKQGFQITSINYDKPDYVEYEVVKADQTYEVQIALDKNTHKATKVDIDTNMYKADTTDQVLKGKKIAANEKNDKKLFNASNKRFSDRDRKSNWEKGKEELVRALKPGEDKPFYRRELEKHGYQITSVNSDKPDYVEYEVVKGDRTYEVQIALDKNTHKATKVDVDTNLWRADATEQALKGRQAKANTDNNKKKQ
ncbi:MAG TPA: hypothetical protein VGL11_07520 [Candidatus Binatia bacterium]|jgi:uncharacterized protein YmfQ (DUF2313 family)